MIQTKYLSVKLNDYEIKGKILSKQNTLSSKKTIFYIHGAKSDYNSLDSLLYPLYDKDVSSVSFNLSGHNIASGVKLESTSLKNNLEESNSFFNSINTPIRNVLGFSFGGALAMKIAQMHKESVERIVLLAPALYTQKAYEVNFGKEFKSTISKPFSFLDSKSLSFLKTYTGKLLLIVGEFDGLKAEEFGAIKGTSAGNITLNGKNYYSPIPYEVIKAIEQSMPKENFEKIILKGCDHSIPKWLSDKPDLAKQLSKKISSFLD